MELNGKIIPSLKQIKSIILSPDGHVTLESVVTPGQYVGIDSEGVVTAANDASNECAHFTPRVKVLHNCGHSHTCNI